MKARTKLQRELLEKRKSLPILTDAQRRWAIGNIFDKTGYYVRKYASVWCMCCGHEDHTTIEELAVSLELTHICPECGKPLALKSWNEERAKFNKGEVSEVALYSIITAYEEWTVIRTFEFGRMNVKGKETEYNFKEVYQIWIDSDGSEVILSKGYYRSPSFFRWNHESEWGVNQHNEHCSGYFIMNDVYDTHGNFFYPRQHVTPILKRNGWHSDLTRKCRIDMVSLMKLMLKEPVVEEMVKTRQYDVLRYWVNSVGRLGFRYGRLKWLHSVRICIRNHYQIKDASIYFDYLDLLDYFHKDTHNAKYVCPKNLKAEHDRLMERKERKERAIELAEKIKTAEKFEAQYKKHWGRFFGICFGNEGIMVMVICSVKEMAEEGTVMKHCVFQNGYYNHKIHPDSLILSARDRKGNRLETVEVNTKTWKVIQSRGLRNQPTGRHEEIVGLVEKNMHLLMKAG